MPIPSGGPQTPSRLHALAHFDLARAALPLTTDLYLAEVTKSDAALTFPYGVVWPPPATRGVEALDGWSGGVTTSTQVTGVGRDKDEVLDILDRIAEALHGVTPSIAGRNCGQILQQPSATPPQPLVDPKVRTSDGRPVYFSFLIFNLYSTLAAS